MAGWYPSLAPHELDNLGELGRRIQATINELSPPSADQYADHIEYLEDENRGLLEEAQVYQRMLRALLEWPRLPKTAHAAIEKVLKNAEN